MSTVLRLGPDAAPILALPVRRRSVVVVAGALVLALVLAWVTVTVGDLGIPPGELWQVLTGGGSRSQQWSLWTNRLPRLAVGFLAGAAFALAGSLFQSVTRNPLGSPDLIGLGAGASAGAAAAALVWPGVIPAPVGALAGALVAVVAVYLGSGKGFAAPQRMVVTGIAVAAMAVAFVRLALARASREDALEVMSWVTGTLAARSWSQAALIAAAVLVLAPVAVALNRPLLALEMGDDAAIGLGVRVPATRTGAVLVAVGLTAAAVSVAGPVGFVALTSPQIARRLTGAPGPGPVAAGAVGAVLMLAADLVAQRAVAGTQYPVGVVTGALGGIYLAVLLIREWRKGTV